MRLAFSFPILKASDTKLEMKIFDVATIGSSNIEDALITYQRSSSKDNWVMIAVTMPMVTDGSVRFMKSLNKRFKATGGKAWNSPLILARQIISERGCLTVWDANLEKFRNAATMKDGENAYELVGVKGMTINAENDEKAASRAKRMITELMIEKPDQAVTLAGWFSAGCKVKKLASGKAPDAPAIASLANPSEADLAKSPIKMEAKIRDDSDEDDSDEKAPKKPSK